jgi:CMP/dCMP kinase
MGLQIAIDGPAGSGKSSISKILAKKYNLIHLDTGAMYRAYAYYCQMREIDFLDEELVVNSIVNTNISFDCYNNVFIDTINITEKLRTPEISNGASKIATYRKVREIAVSLQRKMAEGSDVVMDGRDIGSVVLPNAKYKFFLNASAETRAVRRKKELLEKYSIDRTMAEIVQEIKERDERDYNRKESPLIKCDDAYEIITDDLDMEQVCNQISSIVGL